MNIIYRVIQKGKDWFSNVIIDQNVIEAKTKDDFKDAIKTIYGDKIKFANNKNVAVGDLFISIISYDCNNPEEYLGYLKATCDNCGKEFITTPRQVYKIDNYMVSQLKNLDSELYEKMEKEIEQMTFCCRTCREKKFDELYEFFRQSAIAKDGFANEWVTRYSANDDSGYIYMITKKSTSEFYVGKTNALPMFRWVQHLKTDRFPLEKITDYQFEILEHCHHKLTERENYWINLKHSENPSKCLNVIIPKEKGETK